MQKLHKYKIVSLGHFKLVSSAIPQSSEYIHNYISRVFSTLTNLSPKVHQTKTHFDILIQKHST